MPNFFLIQIRKTEEIDLMCLKSVFLFTVKQAVDHKYFGMTDWFLLMGSWPPSGGKRKSTVRRLLAIGVSKSLPLNLELVARRKLQRNLGLTK
jgi:hypothetical protein